MAGSKPRTATLRLISELLDVPSPSGREEQLAGVVRKKVTAFGYSPETDGAGNVIVRIPTQSKDRLVHKKGTFPHPTVPYFKTKHKKTLTSNT